MNRRRFVTRTATVASALLAGCLGAQGKSGASGRNLKNATMTDTDDANCPTFGETADEHVCSHGGDRPDAPVVLRPEAAMWTPGGNGISTFTFTLVNRSGVDFDVDTDAWTIRWKQKNSWSVVESNEGSGTTTTVSPRDEHEWSLSREPHPTPYSPDTTFIVAAVQSWTYALTVTGTLAASSEPSVQCTALFDVR